MNANARKAKNAAALLAELLVKGVLDDVEPTAYNVTSGRYDVEGDLSIQVDYLSEARSLAAAVLPDGGEYTAKPTAEAIHHTWRGRVRGVEVRVVTLERLGKVIPAELDPLEATSEDDYLRRLIAAGLVIDDRA